MRLPVVKVVAVVETTEPIQSPAGDVRSVGAHDGQGRREHQLPDGDEDEWPGTAALDHADDGNGPGDGGIERRPGEVPLSEPLALQRPPRHQRGTSSRQQEHGYVGEEVAGEAKAAIWQSIAADLGLCFVFGHRDGFVPRSCGGCAVVMLESKSVPARNANQEQEEAPEPHVSHVEGERFVAMPEPVEELRHRRRSRLP